MIRSFPELTVAGMAGDGMLILREKILPMAKCRSVLRVFRGLGCHLVSERLLQLTVLS